MIVVIAFTSATKIILSPAGIRNGESPWRKAAGGSKISYLSCVSVEGFVWWWKSLSYRVLLATFLLFTLLSLSDCLSQDIGLLLSLKSDRLECVPLAPVPLACACRAGASHLPWLCEPTPYFIYVYIYMYKMYMYVYRYTHMYRHISIYICMHINYSLILRLIHLPSCNVTMKIISKILFLQINIFIV